MDSDSQTFTGTKEENELLTNSLSSPATAPQALCYLTTTARMPSYEDRNTQKPKTK
jgi:hypothetical protein